MAKQENILKVFPLKSLHNKYGIDWQRKDLLKYYKHEGSFTIKGLIKEFNINSKDLVFVCIRYKDSFLDRIETKYTTISLQLQSDSPKYNIETTGYLTKGEVEKIRKQEDIVAYVVVVDSTNIIPITKHETSLRNLIRVECDENTRFIYKPSIGRLYLDGYKYSTWRERNDLEQALDKSGYSIILKRRKLHSQLKNMHEKRLREVVSSAFNKENAELFNKIIEVKKELAGKVLQANTETDMRNVTNNLSTIKYIIGRYEEHIQKLQNVNNAESSSYAKYNSIREVEKEIKGMYTQLACVKID